MDAQRAPREGVAANLQWPALTRRRLLLGMAAGLGGFGLAAGAAGCARVPGRAPDGHPLRFLDADEAALVAAVSEAVRPEQAGFPSSAEAEVVRRFDEELSFVGEALQQEMHAALAVLGAAPFLYGRFRRFARLEPAARREVLTALCRSRSETLRAVGSNLKLLVQFFYFAHPSVWAAIGYEGPYGRLPQQISEQRHFYAEATGRQAS